MKRLTCFNCGEDLGEGRSYPGDIDSCGKPECEREARDVQRSRDEEARQRAAEDDYERYR